MNLNSKEWLAVVNVYAASKKALKFWKTAERLLHQKNVDFSCCLTGECGNAFEITLDACRQGQRKLIAVGGDGTAHDVLNGIMAYVDETASSAVSVSDFTVAIVPVGSGNDWVKSLGIPADLDVVTDLIASGSIGRQDVVKASIFEDTACQKVVSTSYMINIGGVGLDAGVCEMVNKAKKQGKRGKILYVTSLLRNLAVRKPLHVKLLCDDVIVFDGNYLSLAIGVGRYSGGGMRQTPSAVLDDGLMDITLIPDLPVMTIAKEAPKLFTGTFDTVKELVVSKCRSALIVPVGESSLVEVDGEVVGRSPVRFDVLDEQINVLSSSGTSR